MSRFDIIYAVLGVTAFIFAVTLVFLLVRHKDGRDDDDDESVSIQSHPSFSQRGPTEPTVLGGPGTAGGPTAPRVPEPAVLPLSAAIAPSGADAHHGANIERERAIIYQTPPATANGVPPTSIATTPSSAWATNSSRPQTALSDGTTFSSIGSCISPSTQFQPIPHSSILPPPAQPQPHPQVLPPPPLTTIASFPEEPPEYEP